MIWITKRATGIPIAQTRNQGPKAYVPNTSRIRATHIGKLYYFAILLSLSFSSYLYADEQPPFDIQDPAINENFRVIYLGLSQHRHDGIDSSMPFNWIPASSATYDLGGTSATWRNLYIGTITAGAINIGTATTLSAVLQVGSGSDLPTGTNIQILNNQGTGNSAGIAAHNSANDVETAIFAESGNAGSVGTTSNNGLKIFTNQAEVIRVTTNSTVGIGNPNPLATLHVGASTSTVIATNIQILNNQNTNNSAGLALHNNMGVETILFAESGLAGSVGTSSNHKFKFVTNNSEIFEIPISAVATGGALCLNSSKVLSKCTSAVDASGNCTCP